MQKSFQGVLETMGTVPFRVVVRLPFDPSKVWPECSPARSRLRVKGTIRSAGKGAKTAEGFAFSGLLIGKRKGDHLLVVTQKIQKSAGVAPGGLAAIVLEPDLDEVSAPAELTKLLKSDRSVLKWFDRLNYSTKKYLADMIREPKSAQTRQRRAEQWAERIMLTMEGEQEIPPILRVAFGRYPQAQPGWDALTVNQRRIHLLSLFSSQSPEARAKQVVRIVEDAMRAGGRGKNARTVAGNEE
jgi:uncharacterized protein YdeI (YjbR/CyaY-like superfamily)